MAGVMTSYMRNWLCDQLVDTLNSGSLKFLEAANTVVATLTFNATAFGNAGSSVVGQAALLTGTAVQDTSAVGGTISASGAAIYQSAGTAVFTEISCGTSGTQIDLSSLTISAGDTVTLSSLTITVPSTTT